MNQPTKPKAVMGRPTKYNEKLSQRICELVSTHPWGLKRICAHYDELPEAITIHEWRLKYKDFASQYAKAKAQQVEFLAEDCINISDAAPTDAVSVAHARLMTDTRKWYVSKLAPKIYGDKLQIEQKEDENEELRAQIKILRSELDAKNKRDY